MPTQAPPWTLHGKRQREAAGQIDPEAPLPSLRTKEQQLSLPTILAALKHFHSLWGPKPWGSEAAVFIGVNLTLLDRATTLKQAHGEVKKLASKLFGPFAPRKQPEPEALFSGRWTLDHPLVLSCNALNVAAAHLLIVAIPEFVSDRLHRLRLSEIKDTKEDLMSALGEPSLTITGKPRQERVIEFIRRSPWTEETINSAFHSMLSVPGSSYEADPSGKPAVSLAAAGRGIMCDPLPSTSPSLTSPCR